MRCPYCDKEMEKGIISGDGRSRVYWKSVEKKSSLFDRLCGKGQIEAAEYSFAAFTIEAHYCVGCRKMIFDTAVSG